ncbi:MFS transporter [Thermophilibacter sp.]
MGGTSGGARRVLVLLVGAAVLLFLGLIYAYSVLLAPLKAAFGWDVSGMTLVFALSIIAFTVGCLVSGEIERRGHARRGLVLGAALLLAGFVGTSAVGGGASLGAACASYGLVASLGIGIVYNVVIPTVTAWFPDRCGMAQGVSLMGFGSGGFVLGPAVTQLYAIADWRAVLLGLGVALTALVLASAAVLRPPEPRELAGIAGAAPAAEGDGAAREAGVGEMVRDRTFRLLYAFLFMLGSVGMGVTGIGRELPLALGVDDMTAAFVIGFVNIGSGLGRLGGGAVLDRLGRGRTMCGIAAVGTVAPLVMVASLVLGSVAVQVVACLLTGIGWGAAVVSMPYVTRTEWGQRNMAENMAVVNTYSIPGSMVGSWGAGLLSTLVGSYVPTLLVMCAMGAVSVVVALRMRAGAPVMRLGENPDL